MQEDHNYGEPGPSTLRHSSRLNHSSRQQSSTEQVDKPVNTVESSIDPLRIPEGNTYGRNLRTRTIRANTSNADNESDPDDDKPLHLMVTESPTKARPSRQQSRLSDEHASQANAAGSSSAANSSIRSVRNQKRPHYNEIDSDEEDGHRSKRQAQGR